MKSGPQDRGFLDTTAYHGTCMHYGSVEHFIVHYGSVRHFIQTLAGYRVTRVPHKRSKRILSLIGCNGKVRMVHSGPLFRHCCMLIGPRDRSAPDPPP